MVTHIKTVLIMFREIADDFVHRAKYKKYVTRHTLTFEQKANVGMKAYCFREFKL